MSENSTVRGPVVLKIVFKDSKESVEGLRKLVTLRSENFISLDQQGQKQAGLVQAFGYWGGDRNREFVVVLYEKCSLNFFADCMNQSLERFEFA